jgi:type IV secretory pathway component VirB8
MNYIDRSILKNIKKGRYFTDAINWYERKYIYPSTERSILIILAFLFVVSSLVMMKFTTDIFPLKKVMGVPIMSKDIENEVPIIKAVSTPGESVTYSLAKYLLTNYVITRESYNNEILTTQNEFVLANSFRDVYEEYAKQVDLANINSPIYRYQNNFTRKIDVVSIKSNGSYDKVNIFFTAKVINYVNEVVESSQWRAEISFIMSDIEKEVSDKLNFLVSEYKVEKIE